MWLVGSFGCSNDGSVSSRNVGITASIEDPPLSVNASPNSVPLKCSDPSDYDVTTIEDYPRRAKNVNILVNGKVSSVLEMPNQNEFNGFSLDWAKKTKDGIEISVEYGSRYYFSKRFIFECNETELVLTQINTESFDKNKPDKWKNTQVKIKPPVPVSKFRIADYLKF